MRSKFPSRIRSGTVCTPFAIESPAENMTIDRPCRKSTSLSDHPPKSSKSWNSDHSTMISAKLTMKLPKICIRNDVRYCIWPRSRSVAIRPAIAMSLRISERLSTLHHQLSLADSHHLPGDHNKDANPDQLESQALPNRHLPKVDLVRRHDHGPERQCVGENPDRLRKERQRRQHARKNVDCSREYRRDAAVIQDPESGEIDHEAQAETDGYRQCDRNQKRNESDPGLSLIHISEPTR